MLYNTSRLIEKAVPIKPLSAEGWEQLCRYAQKMAITFRLSCRPWCGKLDSAAFSFRREISHTISNDVLTDLDQIPIYTCSVQSFQARYSDRQLFQRK